MGKVSGFIEQLVERYKAVAVGEIIGILKLGLYNTSTAFAYGTVWSDISALECSFKGYSRVRLNDIYGARTEPTTGKWQVKTTPISFSYNSGAGAGLTSETAFGWFLIRDLGGVISLLEYEDLPVSKVFTADGDELVREHKFIELNCVE